MAAIGIFYTFGDCLSVIYRVKRDIRNVWKIYLERKSLYKIKYYVKTHKTY